MKNGVSCSRVSPKTLQNVLETGENDAAQARAFQDRLTIIGVDAELERSLIVERVLAGMRRARLEGQHIGRNPLVLDDAAIQKDLQDGKSLRQIAKGHRVSTATIQRVPSKASSASPGPHPR